MIKIDWLFKIVFFILIFVKIVFFLLHLYSIVRPFVLYLHSTLVYCMICQIFTNKWNDYNMILLLKTSVRAHMKE